MAKEFYNAAVVHERFADLRELRAYASKLIDDWDKSQTKPFYMKPEFDVQSGGPLIWSFANHVVNLMRTVLELSEKDRVLHSLPLIRLMVENTMTAIWLYLEPTKARAIIREGFRQRRAAFENLVETEAAGFDRSDIEEIDAILAKLDLDLPNFEQRCRQILGGLSIYCHWRLLSTYSHAGMGLGDFYLKEIPEEPWLAFDPDAKLTNHEAWLAIAICMFISAMKVCNLIDGKGRLKSQIAKAEKRVGLGLDFVKIPVEEKKNGRAHGKNGSSPAAPASW